MRAATGGRSRPSCMVHLGMRALATAAALLVCAACVDLTDFDHCEIPALPEVAADVTWHADVRRVVEAKCATCHAPGEIGPFPLTTYDEVFALRDEVREAVVSRSMPPWQPAPCCNAFQDDFSLDAEQIATIERWVELGAPEGDEADVGPELEVVRGISRVDAEVAMREPYEPQPADGRVDDFRCFVADWPLDEPVFVTGIEPVPGARAILHHIVVAYASGDDADGWDDLESEDGRPGLDCDGGIADLKLTGILGGSLLGGDFPEGIGTRIEPGTKILLNVHYSLSDAAPEADLTRIRFKVDPISTPIRKAGTIVVANPAWLVSDAMRVEANTVKTFRFQYDPRIYMRGDEIDLRGFTPHMHEFGTKMIAGVVRADGTKVCLTDIQNWDFGWEQPFWFAEPIAMDPGDEVYIECTFDNTAENQPIIGGRRIEPRDIAWGTDQQDMCAGFVVFSFQEDE